MQPRKKESSKKRHRLRGISQDVIMEIIKIRKYYDDEQVLK